jgi:adenylate cyclase class 1
MNRAVITQMFYDIQDKKVAIYIVDKLGALFIQKIHFHDSQSLINNFTLFFGSTIKRRNILNMEKDKITENFPIEFYHLKKSLLNHYATTNIEINPDIKARSYFNIQVMGNLYEDNKTTLCIYCEDKEFSSLDHSNDLFKAVAQHVLDGRASGQTYPIYITDMDLSRSLIFDPEVDSLQTTHFLKCKNRIEEKLNAALTEL